MVKIEKNLIFLLLFFIINLAGLIYFHHYYINNGYLPSPFLYNKADTFMDFYNTLYWSNNDGRYTEWKSVYPPLNFIILRLINFYPTGEITNNPFSLRENSSYLVLILIIFYLLSNVFILKTKYWKEFNSNEKILIYLSLIISSPVLFSIERGNLILICPAIFALVTICSGIKRAFYIALLINIKPYFIILNIYYIVKKDWKGLFNTLILSGAVFLITAILLGGEFYGFFKNIFDFSQNKSIFSLRELMAMPSSISFISFILKSENGAAFASGFISFQYNQLLILIIEIFKWLILVFSVIVIWKNNKNLTELEIFTVIILIISNINVWIGGYIYIMYIVLIPVFLKMHAKFFFLGCILLMSFPLDIIPLMNDFIGFQLVYLTNLNINIHWTLGLGGVIRPILNIGLLIAMTYELLVRAKEKQN